MHREIQKVAWVLLCNIKTKSSFLPVSGSSLQAPPLGSGKKKKKETKKKKGQRKWLQPNVDNSTFPSSRQTMGSTDFLKKGLQNDDGSLLSSSSRLCLLPSSSSSSPYRSSPLSISPLLSLPAWFLCSLVQSAARLARKASQSICISGVAIARLGCCCSCRGRRVYPPAIARELTPPT